jgi:CheY-like chemotaxis protein
MTLKADHESWRVKPPPTAESLGPRRVLIVEDEQFMRNLLQTLLESMGCQSTSVPVAHAALDLIRRMPFDAILLDLHCSSAAPSEVISGILEIHPRLIGKVLLIDGGIDDAKTMTVVEYHRCPIVYRDRIVRDLWYALQRVFQAPSVPSEAA